MYNEEIIEANKKAYEREVELAMSIVDPLPSIRVDQDLRSKNRVREHSGEGHSFVSEHKWSRNQPNHELYKCSCGWVGWIIPKFVEE